MIACDLPIESGDFRRAVPQWLKPKTLLLFIGATEVAPLQNKPDAVLLMI
jgi:hypothetical protein